MKKSRKLFLTIGSLASISTVALAGTCSTSWTKWKKEGTGTTTVSIKKPSIETDKKLFEVRDDVFEKAYDKKSHIVNLNKVNNQFELLDVITKILNFKAKNSLDEFWNKFEDLKEFSNGLKTKEDIHFTFTTQDGKTKSFVYKWDIESIQFKVDQGISEYQLSLAAFNKTKPKTYQDIIDEFNQYVNANKSNKNLVDAKKVELLKNEISELKGYDIELTGISVNGTPKDFAKVAELGMPLINIGIVKALMNVDSNLALKTSKLVNLPLVAFNAFKDLLVELDKLLDEVFTKDTSKPQGEWFKDKNFASNRKGIINSKFKKDIYNIRSLMKGEFLVMNLKSA